jgi:SAM-dependent methyltransferase
MNQELRCPICLHGSAWPVSYRHDDRLDAWRAEIGDRGPHDWFLCQRCANLFPSRQPDLRVLRRVWETARIEQEAQSVSDAVRNKIKTIGRTGAERSFRFFAPLAGAPPGPFLDIACGIGETVRLFADRGWDAEGIDADPTTEAYHRELGIRTRIGQFEQLDFERDYAVIHIAHAIYFITEPMEFLGAVRARLQPQGLFCVVLADFMATDDPALPSYGHTFFPTAASMRYALALAGFETVFTRHLSGSIFIAARPSASASVPPVHPAITWAGWRTKRLRYKLLGRPYLALRGAAKALLRRAGLRT